MILSYKKQEVCPTRRLSCFLCFLLSFGLFFSIPAIGAKFTGRDSYGFYQIIQPVEPQCGKIQPLSDLFNHGFIVFAVRVRITVQNLLGNIIPFPVADDAAGDQIQLRGRSGEIQIVTAKEQRRAGGADMDLFRSALI